MTPEQQRLAERATALGFKDLYVAAFNQYPAGDSYLYKKGHLYGTLPGREDSCDANVPEITEELLSAHSRSKT